MYKIYGNKRTGIYRYFSGGIDTLPYGGGTVRFCVRKSIENLQCNLYSRFPDDYELAGLSSMVDINVSTFGTKFVKLFSGLMRSVESTAQDQHAVVSSKLTS